MKNWSIRWRINCAFAVIFALIVIMAGIALYELLRIERARYSLAHDSLPGIEHAAELRSAWTPPGSRRCSARLSGSPLTRR
jgi:hypothetical protein